MHFIFFFGFTALVGTSSFSDKKCYAQLCPTLRPMDCSPPGSSVHGISQARILEWVCHFLLQGIFLTDGLNRGRCQPCSGPAAGGICPPRGTGCGHPPGETPPPRWQTLISAGLALPSPPGGRVTEPVGLARSPCTCAQLRTLWGNRLLWEGRASSLELRLWACCRGLTLKAGAGASLRSTVLESTAANGPHFRGEHRELQEGAPGHTVTRPGSKVQYR